MDFIMALPKVDGYGSIMVVVDRFSKYAVFVAAPPTCSADHVAQLFVKNVVKYWGLPETIVSDRDPRFTGRFWTEVFRLLGSELHFSTSFHPQTDGQTERINALLEEDLRHFVNANQRDWVHLLEPSFAITCIRAKRLTTVRSSLLLDNNHSHHTSSQPNTKERALQLTDLLETGRSRLILPKLTSTRLQKG